MKTKVCPYDCFNRLQENHRVFVQADHGGAIYELLEPTYIAEYNKQANCIWKYKGFVLRDVNNHTNTFGIRNNVLGAHFEMYEFVGGLPMDESEILLDRANRCASIAVSSEGTKTERMERFLEIHKEKSKTEQATVGIDYANGADITAYTHVRFP